MLHCSAIFHWATVLSHFLLLQCPPFCNAYNELSNFCYNAQSFYSFASHSRWFSQAFCYAAWPFYDFVSHYRDPVSHFTTMLSYFVKLLRHSRVSVSHSLKWFTRSCEVEGAHDLDQGCARAGDGSWLDRDGSRAHEDTQDRAARVVLVGPRRVRGRA
jgi:hypothetical protein